MSICPTSHLKGTNPKLVSSETREKEVPIKAGEDEKLIENITELLSKIEKKELDSLLEKLKKLIENPQSNEKLIEKDVKDKDKDKNLSSSSSLVTSFLKSVSNFLSLTPSITNKDPSTSVEKARAEALKKAPPPRTH